MLTDNILLSLKVFDKTKKKVRRRERREEEMEVKQKKIGRYHWKVFGDCLFPRLPSVRD